MPNINQDTPIFNLKAVVRETGLKADTLRAWERRYGLPTPSRSQGRQRLYCQRDIQVLKWLIARQQEGMTISRAVKLWRQLESDGKDPFAIMPLAPTPPQASTLPAGNTLEQLRHDWIQACQRFDETQAEQSLAQAFALFPAEIVFQQVIAQGLVEIGERWHNNHLTPHQEHFATALARRRIEMLLAACPPPSRSEHLLIGCAPKEEHAIPALLLSYYLKRQGLHITYLGANVPQHQFETTLEQIQPRLLILTSQRLTTAAHLIDIARQIQTTETMLAYGGRLFSQHPALRQRISGYYLGDNLLQVPAQVERILAQPGAPQPAPELSPTEQQALIDFQIYWPQILGVLRASPDPLLRTMNEADFELISTHLTENITAALRFGDITLAEIELPWLQHFLQQRRYDESFLPAYLQQIQKIAAGLLPPSAQVLNTWLQNITRTGIFTPTS
ncbi:MAG: MerR family transcriptional regulator [Chloroflexi bacterium]|nr:MerR family transcriptional regulator [Chloroflexota bacterium]